MGTARGEMTLDRLLARLASLEQENARLRAAWQRGVEELDAHLSRTDSPTTAVIRASTSVPANTRETTSPN